MRIPPAARLCALVYTAALFLANTVLAVSVSVTPSAITSAYTNMLSLQITGLSIGETVVVDRFLDMNGNGALDAADYCSFHARVTDNQSSQVAGFTNFAGPYDANPASGAMSVPLNYYLPDVPLLVGTNFFRVSSPSGHFAPVTVSLPVANASLGQSIGGTVKSSGTNVPYAVVVLLGSTGSGDNNHYSYGMVANASGAYSIKAQPGTYIVLTFKPGYVVDQSASPFLTLNAGATLTTNLTMTPATRTISGKVADQANTAIGLGGVFVQAKTTNHLFTISFTDTNGNFTIPVIAGQWGLKTSTRGAIPAYGYVPLTDNNSSVTANTLTGNATGANILVPQATALIYGTVSDVSGNPVAGVDIFGNDNGGNSSLYAVEVLSDAQGRYSAPVLGGDWFFSPEQDVQPWLTNYVVAGNDGASPNDGEGVEQDLTLIAAPYRITGWVWDTSNNPIGGVNVQAYSQDGVMPNAFQATTDQNGNYSINVSAGNWAVYPDCGSLGNLGFGCASLQYVNNVNGNGRTANFTVGQCVLRIDSTGSLASGVVGQYYSGYISYEGCSSPFTWSVISGALPPGLGLNSTSGFMSGTPTQAGTFNFTVQLMDNNSTTTQQALSITISQCGALQIFQSTPIYNAGFNGGAFVFQAQGCNSPFTWSLVSGSVPTGMNLSTDGSLNGTPTTAGTFNFTIQVMDSHAATAQWAASINVYPTLAVTTASFPNATQSGFYSTQLTATGGLAPYSWSVAPDSAALPSGLGLSSSGLLSGVPTGSGGFGFSVLLTDADGYTAEQALSLTVNSGGGGFGTDVSSYQISKKQQYVQTGTGTPVLSSGTPFEFTAGANGGVPGLVLGLTLKLPNATTQTGNYSSDVNGYEVGGDYATLSQMDSAYPAGNYQLTITTTHDGTKVLTLALPADKFPSVPHVSNFAAAQQVNSGADFKLTWDAFGNAGTRTLIQVRVQDLNGNTVFQSPAVNGPQVLELPSGAYLTAASNSVVIPANTLPPGITYNAVIGFYNAPVFDTNTYPGSIGVLAFQTRTSFTLQTAGPTPLTVTTTSMPNPVQGVFYSQQLVAGGGQTPYGWALAAASASLPDGLNLSSDGVLSGIPTGTGFYGFTVEVTDFNGNVADQGLTFTVYPPDGAPMDVSDYSIRKYQSFLQTSASAPALSGATPFGFAASVNESTPGVVTGLGVKLPNGTVQAGMDNYDSFEVSSNFDTQAHLDTAYPGGKYIFNFVTADNGAVTVTNNFPTTSTYPSTPHVSNYTAAQSINPATDFTLTWDTFTTTLAVTYIQVQIRDGNDNTVFRSPDVSTPGALNASSNHFLIPANTLVANQIYHATLAFYDALPFDTNSLPGAVGRVAFEKQTSFTLNTGAAVQPTLSSITVLPASTNLGAGTNVQFTATLHFSDGSAQAVAASGWQLKASMPTARTQPFAGIINGVLYVAGGFINADASVVEAYNIAANSWSAAASLPNLGDGDAGRYQATAAVLSGQLFVAGGWRNSPPLPTSSLQSYDPTGNSWSENASIPQLSGGSSGGVSNGKFYLMTPDNGYSGYYQIFQMYDPASDTWTNLASIPNVQSLGVAGVLKGKLYIAGGFDAVGNQLNMVQVYDPAANSWSTAAPMPTARSSAGGGAVDGKLVVAGGWNGSNMVSVVEIYDPVSNAWTTGPSLSSPRGGMASAIANHKVYLAGGGNPVVNTLEVLAPQVGWTSSDPSVATIDQNGLLVALAPGTVTVTATSGTVSGTATVVVRGPNVGPTITNQPVSQFVTAGSNVVFSVSASGSTPLFYHWRKGTANIAGATNSTYTILNAQTTAAGTYSVVVSNALGSVTSTNAVLVVNNGPGRTVRVLADSARPGGPAVARVQLIAQGNENGLGFTLAFDPTLLTFGSAAGGANAGDANIIFNTNQVASGLLGVLLSLSPAETFAAGTQEVVQVAFQTALATGATPLQFTNSVIDEQVDDASANELAANWQDGSLSINAGVEGDVTPLPNGDGAVRLADWIQIGRYVAQVDTIPSASAFQRADCAPRSTLGDGRISLLDWVQAGRYAAGLDTQVAAGGPFGPFAPTRLAESPRKAIIPHDNPPILGVVGGLLKPGQLNTISIQLTPQGNENSLSYSLSFDPTVLTFVSATNRSTLIKQFIVNTNAAADGEIGLLEAASAGASLPAGATAGAIVVAQITFRAAANASDTTVMFGDFPIARETADATGLNTLPTIYFDGVLTSPPQISGQPESQTAPVGSEVEFTASATGFGTVSYQWQFKNANIPGATNATLDLTNVQTGASGNYRVVASDAAGSTTGSNANLTVYAPVRITVQPQGKTVIPGATVTLNVTAAGAPPLKYQWQRYEANLPGQTGPTLTIPNINVTNGGAYSVIVSNAYSSVTSTQAQVIVLAPAPTITSPANKTVFVTNNSTILVRGTTPANAGVGEVFWELIGSPIYSASGNTNWQATVFLNPGTNIFVTWAQNAFGYSGNATNLYIFIPAAPLTLYTNGVAPGNKIMPSLGGQLLTLGKSYTLTATASPNQLFGAWFGGVPPAATTLTTNSTYTFVMQSNLVLYAFFETNIFLRAQGNYAGLFAPTNDVRSNTSSGAFTLQVQPVGTFSGKLMIGLDSPSFTGRFRLDGSADTIATRPGKPLLYVHLALDPNSPPGEYVHGFVSDIDFVAVLNGSQFYYSASRKAPFAGQYTFSLPPATDPMVGPAGFSFGTVKVDASGNIAVGGSLADGTGLSESGVAGPGGHWPFYIPLYGGKGSLWGWNDFVNQSLYGNVSGFNLSWINTTNPAVAALYRSGFTNNAVPFYGSPYSPTNQPLLGFTNGVVILQGGNLPAGIINHIAISANNIITVTSVAEKTNKLTLTINKTSGVVTGSFANPAKPTQMVPLNGVILQNQNLVWGYFLGTNQSGVFMMTPQ